MFPESIKVFGITKKVKAVSKWLNFNACDDKSQTHPVKKRGSTV
ncbi:hypothetical protein C900_02734 [Fulvivirga imtechensis AK7]|uniref:Uncharacterized protein n=1 Tax=Fulvivirga imtechensis AK7 TaxID=1237149 RepID=L8JT57_9BACT|nr:hypothetical protein C900_02734 [Fulvivirga imtechensis AK7]